MKNKFKEFKKISKMKANAYSRYEELSKKRYALNKELENFFIKQKLYIPISELSKYEGKDIDEIDLVLDTGEIKHFWKDELMGVADGHFYYSSFERGLYEWDSKIEKYRSHYHYNASEGDNVVGYFNLKLDDPWNDYDCEKEEGKMIDILEKYINEAFTTKAKQTIKNTEWSY